MFEEYTIFSKTVGTKDVWCVYFRDEDGKRLNPIFVSKLKKMVYKGRQRTEPIKTREECYKICEKSLVNETTRDYIFNKKDRVSPNFIETVREILDYDNSPYIQGRIKEGYPILRTTCEQNLKSFNDLVVPHIPKDLTLKGIDKSNGAELTKIKQKLRDEGQSRSYKNKGLQAMRTTLEYCSFMSMISNDYKNRLKNFKIIDTKGNDPLSVEEVNEIISYYHSHTQKGTWERFSYLVSLLGATTGLRPCEIIGLRRQDIVSKDKKNKCGVILVNHGINRDNEYSTRNAD